MSYIIGRGRKASETYPSPPSPGSGSQGLTTSLVWRPNGTPGGNVFTTSTALVAAMKALPNGTFIIVTVDTSLGAAIFTAAAYGTIPPARWVPGGAAAVLVTWADGATYDCLFAELRGVFWVAQGGTSPWQPGAGARFLSCSEDGGLDSQGAAPFLDAPNGSGPALVECSGFASLGGIFGGPTVHVQAGGRATVMLDGQATAAAGTLQPSVGAAQASLQFTDGCNPVDFPAAIPAGWSFAPVSAAFRQLYTAAVVANWSNVNPKSTADALDRIAAHVGPIP